MGLLVALLGSLSARAFHPENSSSSKRPVRRVDCVFVLILALVFPGGVSASHDKESSHSFSMELPESPESVIRAVSDVANDGTIHGTKQYESETGLSGASVANSSNAFDAWTGPGHVFYKEKKRALAPRHFLDSADMGTVTVRYVVEPLAAQRTRLRIEAVFIEDGRRKRHASDGSVETSEFSEIATKIKVIEEQRKEAERQKAENEAQEQERTQLESVRNEEKSKLDAAKTSLARVQLRADSLRREAMARVKSDGTPLRSAPFVHSKTILSLGKYDSVTILVRTPYWYGIVAPDGERGWVRRDALEAMP